MFTFIWLYQFQFNLHFPFSLITLQYLLIWLCLLFIYQFRTCTQWICSNIFGWLIGLNASEYLSIFSKRSRTVWIMFTGNSIMMLKLILNTTLWNELTVHETEVCHTKQFPNPEQKTKIATITWIKWSRGSMGEVNFHFNLFYFFLFTSQSSFPPSL